MSLQVWLPFNGDLHNQGLTEISIINNSTTINNNGKIGKCLHFSEAEYITMSPGFLPEAGKEFSCCYWVKELANNTVSSFRVVYECGQFIVGQYGNKFNVWQTSGGFDIYTVIDSTTWVHCCVTVNATGLCKIYINGQYQTQGTISTYPNSGTTTIGRRTINGTNANNDFLVNDFRIYDHCLSAKEVEEIAKGLVLHYKFDNNGIGGKNLATNTAFPTSTIQGYNGQNAVEYNHNDWTSGGRFFTSYSSSRLTFTEIQANQSYTISAWVYIYDDVTLSSPGGTSIFYRIYKTGSSPTYSYDIAVTLNGITQRNQWVKVSSTFTSPATYTYNQGGTFSIGGYNGHFLVSMPQVELGSIATPWSPNPADLGIDSSIVYDSSGYGNNGIITGDIQTDTNTARYFCSIKQKNGQYVRVGKHPIECMPKDAITVNLWQYATSWANPISCTEGGGWNFENSSGIRFPVYISGVGYKIAQSSITPASTQNAWHMLTGTMNKDNIKIYYDGEEVGTVATGSTNGIGYANNYIFIGAEAGGNSTSPASSAYTGNLSDIRIYATALTADQIKELYNTSATIDKNGNIHARELVEI